MGAHKVAEANQCISWNSATGTDQRSIWEALCSDLNCQACKPLQLFFLFTSSDSVLELHGISLEILRTRSLVDCLALTPGTTAQSSYWQTKHPCVLVFVILLCQMGGVDEGFSVYVGGAGL